MERNENESAAERGEARALPRLELTVDEVIEQHVGSLGLSQILHALIVSLAWIFDAQSTLISIFTDAQPPVRFLGSHASKTGNTTANNNSLCGLAPGSWEWLDGHTSTIVAEWGLICDRKFLAAIPASLFFIGSLLGSSVYGKLADSWLGRKKALLVACLLSAATAFLISFSPNVWLYALMRFANGFLRSGIGICCLVLSTEVIGRKWRGQVGQYGFFFFTAGFLSLPLIAYTTRNSWRTFYKVTSYLPLAYSLLLLPFASESPRWLLVKGRNKEAMDILRKLARLNGRQLPADLSLVNPISEADQASGQRENLWKTKWAAKRMVIVMLAGFGVGFVYYGIQLNSGNLNFNLYLTVAINAIMEIPAVFIGSILLGIMNRRPLFSQSSYLAGISCVLCAIFSINHLVHKRAISKWLQLAVEAVGFMASSTAYDVLYVYALELFPTNVRNFAVSMLRQAFMLGASAAPLLVVMGRVSPLLSFLIFGIASIFSGLPSLWLQETRNAPLYETLKQQEEEENLRSDSNNLSNGSSSATTTSS